MGSPVKSAKSNSKSTFYGGRQFDGSIARIYQEVTENTTKRFGIGEAKSSETARIDMVNEQYIGSDFDDFLAEEGILAEAEAVAMKRVIAYQIEQLMDEQKITKTAMARRMNTSRASLDRLLDPENKSVTLQTLERAALALEKRLRVEFV